MTLFFGQLFVTVVNNGNRISILGFTHGFNITAARTGSRTSTPFHLFGHYLESLTSYYWVALVFFLAVFVDDLPRQQLAHGARLALAARGLARGRDDGHAGQPAEADRVRVRRGGRGPDRDALRLAPTRLSTRADFDTPILITIYAMLILGGAGSLGGMILGAIVVNVSLEVLRTPNHATWVFFILIIATLLAKLRPWKVLAAVFVGTIAFGFAAYARDHGDLAEPRTTATGAVGGRARTARSSTGCRSRPTRRRPATGASSRSSCSILVLTTARPVLAATCC